LSGARTGEKEQSRATYVGENDSGEWTMNNDLKEEVSGIE